MVYKSANKDRFDELIKKVNDRITELYEKYIADDFVVDNKDNIKTSISHSLGSVISHHIILGNEQLNGRLYSTPSLAV